MQTATHGNGRGLDDLYILPADRYEAARIVQYLEARQVGFKWSFSDVEGQEWYGKPFIEIPFGEGLESVIRSAAEVKVQPTTAHAVRSVF